MSRQGRIVAVFVLVIVLIAGSFITLSYSRGNRETLSVFAADAYVPEVASLLSGFHNYTGISVAPVQGGGSFADARQIALGSPASVFISVSLESYQKSFLGNYSSGWAMAFATDQMVLAYSNATLTNPYAESIIKQFNDGVPTNNTSLISSAFTNLTSGNVKLGISNPLSDPAGVRGWLAMEMAGYLYHSGNASYFSNRLESNHANYSSSNAAALVSPLTQGQIQFLFIYKSSAITHKLDYVQLPDSVNQGNASMANFYGEFTYSAGSTSISGSPIMLFISILKNGTAHSYSVRLISFLLNNTGVFSKSGLTLLTPMLLYGTVTDVPAINWGLTSGMIRSESKVL